MLSLTEGFHLFKGRAGFCRHLIKQGSTESVAQTGIVKEMDVASETVIAVAAFRNETVDMGIPFEIPAKGV